MTNGSILAVLRVGHDQHVRVVDRLPAADRGTVETDPLFEGLFAELADRRGKVLPDADKVEELVIDHLAVVVLGKLDYFLWGHRVTFSLLVC